MPKGAKWTETSSNKIKWAYQKEPVQAAIIEDIAQLMADVHAGTAREFLNRGHGAEYTERPGKPGCYDIVRGPDVPNEILPTFENSKCFERQLRFGPAMGGKQPALPNCRVVIVALPTDQFEAYAIYITNDHYQTFFILKDGTVKMAIAAKAREKAGIAASGAAAGLVAEKAT